jgi:PBP1b-binding outer membrane lipoprotein LpoB
MMTLNKGNTQRQIRASILCVICACTVLLSGCSKAANENTQVTHPTPSTEAATPAATNSVTEQPNASSSSKAEGLPEGVSVQRAIKDVSLKDGYHKKIELLTDGGKLVTITDPNQKIVLQQIEYEGRITAANGKQVTVNVEGGAEQTITIPDHVVIEDEDKLGLNKGIEIEWTVNAEGQIESVELDD